MNMLKNLRVGTRLAAAFGLVLVLLCAMAGMAAFQLARLNDLVIDYATNLIPSFTVQHDIAIAVSELRRNENRYLLVRSATEMDETDAKMATLRSQISAGLDQYEKSLISDDQDHADLNASRASIASYEQDWAPIRELARAALTDPSKADEAKQMLMTGDSAKRYEAAHAAVETWWKYNLKLADADQTTSAAAYRLALRELVGLALAAAALGIAGAVLITRSITRPIGDAVALAGKVAAGDLTARVVVDGRDELADLMRSLGAMNEGLAKVVGDVRSSAESIATGAGQIAAGNIDLSQRTEEQASNLQQTAASMEQLHATVKNNADTARQASLLADAASDVAARGGQAVGEVVATMHEIADSSKRIGDIIGVIDGIAFQTNILALNAAVEAARAGEQGRGFAVVASEVRSLAQRSAQAAKEIKTLIGASGEKVDAGTRQVARAGETMAELVGSVKRVNDLIGEISAATIEQSTGIGQVNDAVTQLDQVTQQNAALVEESTAASASLRQQADHLVAAVGAFRIEGGATTTRPVRATPAPGATPAGGLPKRPAPARAAARPAPAPSPSPLSVPVSAPATRDPETAWEAF